MKRAIAKHTLPLVSVCITSLNYGRYLGQSIDSALAQSYANIEVVVNDNGSTDETFEVLANYRKDKRVKIYRNDTALSMVANHNAAIQRASGEYILMLSADDMLLPHHVATLMARILDPQDPVDIAFGQVAYCDADRAPLGTPFAYGILPIDYSLRDDFAVMLLVYSHMLPAKLVPKSLYEKLGYFDENISSAFDVDFALRIELAEYRIGVLHDVLAILRIHPSSASTTGTSELLSYHCDKLTYLEKIVTPEHTWRLEYIGRLVANTLESERMLIASDQLDPQVLERSERVVAALLEASSKHVAWPAHRPLVTVIVHTHGATKQLLATLETLSTQQLQEMEIVVVQTKGVGVGHLLSSLPYAAKVRYVKAPHLTNSGGVLRMGIELSRARYVAYLEEGQTIPRDQYATLVKGIEEAGADFVYTDASAVEVAHIYTSSTVGHTPFIPVQRGEVLPSAGTLSFSQMLLRRNLLIGVQLFDYLYEVSEEVFIEALKFHFHYVFFERRRMDSEAHIVF